MIRRARAEPRQSSRDAVDRRVLAMHGEGRGRITIGRVGAPLEVVRGVEPIGVEGPIESRAGGGNIRGRAGYGSLRFQGREKYLGRDRAEANRVVRCQG